ncbi:uncharacterized protein LOC110107372, partial [Dendrobium catenatum]|uniref:uncharacterized protein LOC110107372 n=1 Tax=Dendrobium catenatum TaxID=906689 RepID=UPI0009F6A8F9
MENARKLNNSLVIKIFGGAAPLAVISSELRRQWAQYGKLHLTMLSQGWILCSFQDSQSAESILTNGPCFVNNKIIGMDRWSKSFSPTSLKGLTSPIWIRLPNLPLECWDNINICRISSMIGKPILIDGNMFQWGRREFGRVCVRIRLDKKLPVGVWVEGSSGKFFQEIEYEQLPNFCFKCGLIGHVQEVCREGNSPPNVKEIHNAVEASDAANSLPDKANEEEMAGDPKYGPWMVVNRGRKKTVCFSKEVNLRPLEKKVWRKSDSTNKIDTGDRLNETHSLGTTIENSCTTICDKS